MKKSLIIIISIIVLILIIGCVVLYLSKNTQKEKSPSPDMNSFNSQDNSPQMRGNGPQGMPPGNESDRMSPPNNEMMDHPPALPENISND